MKRHTGFFLSTISTAAVTAVLGTPATAITPPAELDRPPIERLASIREAYLSALKDGTSTLTLQNDDDQIVQFRNFPNFPNFSNWRNR